MGRYDPLSYHNGSVWPHDTALAAAGLTRYGYVDEAHRLIDGLLAAANHYDRHLPELFTGLGRAEAAVPVDYPTSSAPQAWAAAAPLLATRALLRFDPDVPRAGLSIHLAPAPAGRCASCASSSSDWATAAASPSKSMVTRHGSAGSLRGSTSSTRLFRGPTGRDVPARTPCQCIGRTNSVQPRRPGSTCNVDVDVASDRPARSVPRTAADS